MKHVFPALALLLASPAAFARAVEISHHEDRAGQIGSDVVCARRVSNTGTARPTRPQ